MTTLAKLRNGNVRPSLSSWFDDMFDREMNQIFNPVQPVRNTMPALNISESEDEFILELAAPGMKKDEFHISVDNGLLTLSSEKEETTEDDSNKYTRKEYSYSSFKRTLTLPDSVDTDQISAKYEDGILKINVPKLEEAKPKPIKTITIK